MTPTSKPPAVSKPTFPHIPIAATARYADQVAELQDAGVSIARNLYGEAGQDLPDDPADLLEPAPGDPRRSATRSSAHSPSTAPTSSSKTSLETTNSPPQQCSQAAISTASNPRQVAKSHAYRTLPGSRTSTSSRLYRKHQLRQSPIRWYHATPSIDPYTSPQANHSRPVAYRSNRWNLDRVPNPAGRNLPRHGAAAILRSRRRARWRRPDNRCATPRVAWMEQTPPPSAPAPNCVSTSQNPPHSSRALPTPTSHIAKARRQIPE